MRVEDPTARPARSTLVFAIVATIAFVALGLLAPVSSPPCPPSPNDAFLERVFPRVPAAWIFSRFLAMSFAVGCFGVALRTAPGQERLPSPDRDRPMTSGPRAILAITIAAALLCAALPVVRGESILVQGVWLIVVVLLPLGLVRPSTPPLQSAVRRMEGLVWVLPILVWLGWRVVVFPDPLRAADLVDAWLGLERARIVASGAETLLGDSFLPGATNAYMVMEGIPFLASAGIVPSFEQLRWSHALWTAFAALALGSVCARRYGSGPAALAVTALLFSPFVLHTGYSPLPIFLGPLFTAALVWLLDSSLNRGKAFAFVMIGPVAGLAATVPALVPVAGLTMATALVGLRKRREFLPLVPGLLFGFVAPVLPSVPGPETLRRMASEYTTGSAVWITLERLLMGQISPYYVASALASGSPGPMDVPFAALVSPWMSARTPMRLIGDHLYDPLTIVAFSVGLLAALRRARRDVDSLWLLLLLAVSVLPGVLSSYDRPSHTRMFAAPVAIALLASTGYAALLSFFGPTRVRAAAAAGLATASALLGTILFDRIDAGHLERSFLSIALGTAKRTSSTGLVVEHPDRKNLSWLHYDRIVDAFAGPESRIVDPDSAFAALASQPDTTIFVSPGLEQASKTVTEACRRVPEASVLVLHDATGHSRAFGLAVQPPSGAANSRNGDVVIPCGHWPQDLPPAPSCGPR